MNISGKRITLRAVEREDLALLHKWANDPDVAGLLGELHFPSSLLQQERWYERIQADRDTVRLSVVRNEGGLIGYSGFWHIDWRDRRAEHAVLLGDPKCRGQGYGCEVILSCARYAFEQMALHRLEARVLEANEASLAAYRSCGFVAEGALREYAVRSGRRVDMILLGLLSEEYTKHIEETRYWEAPEDVEPSFADSV